MYLCSFTRAVTVNVRLAKRTLCDGRFIVSCRVTYSLFSNIVIGYRYTLLIELLIRRVQHCVVAYVGLFERFSRLIEF